MSDSLLYTTLQNIQSQLEALRREVNGLNLRVTKLEAQAKKQGTSRVSKAAPQTLEVFGAEVLHYITDYWTRDKSPCQARFISQAFSRRAYAFGGIRTVLDSLISAQKISVIHTYSGAYLYFPFETFAEFSPQLKERFRTAGLSEKQLKRIKDRLEAVANLEFENKLNALNGPTDAQLEAYSREAAEKFAPYIEKKD